MSGQKRINSRDIPLQRLKVTAGWTIIFNNFYDISPDECDKYFIEDFPNGDSWLFLESDLLQMNYDPTSILLDLGWTEPAEPSGKYALTLIKHDFCNPDGPIVKYSTRSKDEIVDKINELIFKVARGEIM